MKILNNTITECSINQIVKSDISRLIKIAVLREKPLCWVNGILFDLTEFESEEVTKLQTEGKLFLETLAYADCKEKPDNLKFNGVQVEVLDFTNYSMYSDLIKSVLEIKK